MRTCPVCGLEEQRTRDTYGRETMNLDPVSGKCVPCLVATTIKSKPMKEPSREPFDSKAVAARNDA